MGFNSGLKGLRYNGLAILCSEEEEGCKGSTGKRIWRSVEELRFLTLEDKKIEYKGVIE
jgi:hypothetical protein